MDEATWLASDNPQAMLSSLLAGMPTPGGYDMGHGLPAWSPRVAPPASGRKLLLWAEACEGLGYCLFGRGNGTAAEWATHLAQCVADRPNRHFMPDVAALLRDVFGNPFRPVKLVEVVPSRWPNSEYHFRPSWLSWQGGAVVKMAAAIYDERAFDRMPVLADLLEEAGCQDKAILRHCRGWERCHNCVANGPPCDVCKLCQPSSVGWLPIGGALSIDEVVHARGCWVIDLLTGRS